MQGVGESEESERRRKEDKRGIVLCGSPQSLFSLVAITTGRERTDKLTRWLETWSRSRACVFVCRCDSAPPCRATKVVFQAFLESLVKTDQD